MSHSRYPPNVRFFSLINHHSKNYPKYRDHHEMAVNPTSQIIGSIAAKAAKGGTAGWRFEIGTERKGQGRQQCKKDHFRAHLARLVSCPGSFQAFRPPQSQLAVDQHPGSLRLPVVPDDLVNLKKCYDAVPALQAKAPLTILRSLAGIRLKLWDEKGQKMAGFH